MTTDERLREIREREAKATPGPWHIRPWFDGKACIVTLDNDGDAALVVAKVEDTPESADARLIQECRTDIHWLLSQVDALRADETMAAANAYLHKELAEAREELDAERAAWEEVHAALGFGYPGSESTHKDWLSNAGECVKAVVTIRERAEKAEAECKDREEALYVDETGMFETLRRIRKEINSYSWLLESRGPYEWDDDRYKDEAGRCMQAVDKLAAEAEEKSRQRVRSNDKKLQGVGEPYRKALAEVATLREQLAKAERAETEAYDCIFPYVPEAVDEHGKPLSVAGKIALLIAHCEKAEAERDVRIAAAEAEAEFADEFRERAEKAEAELGKAERFAAEWRDACGKAEEDREMIDRENEQLKRAAAESAALAERMREVLREWVEAMDDWASYRHFTSTSKTGSERLGNAIKAARAALALTLTPSAAPPSQGDSNG